MPLPHIITIFQTIRKLWGAQEFDLEIRSGEQRKRTEQQLSFLHAILLRDPKYVSTKYYQIISNSMGVMACTRHQFHCRQVHKKESQSFRS